MNKMQAPFVGSAMGYLNQILQFGRQINGQNVFQNNKGMILKCVL